MLLLLLGYFFLSQGIQISKLNIDGIHISKLYLKLDKKIILYAKKIEIVTTKKKKTLSMDPYLYLINYFPKVFQKITIDSIQYKNRDFSIYYTKRIFKIFSPDISLKISLWYDLGVNFRIIRFIYKPYSLELAGSGKIYKSNLSFQGRYTIEGIHGDLRIKKRKKILDIFTKTDIFENSNLTKLFSHIPINPLIEEWSCQRIKGEHYKLLFLKAHIDLNRPITPKNFEAHATAKNVVVKFDDQLPGAKIKKVSLRLKNGNLYFDLFKPRYLDRRLDGSKAVIYKLGKSGSYLKLLIKTISPFDRKIKKLLHRYGVDIPIEHKRGVLMAQVEIIVNFKNFGTKIKGDFKTKESLINLEGIDIIVHTGHLKINDDRVIIRPSLVSIDPIVLSKIYGVLDIGKKRGTFVLDIQKLEIKKGFSLLLAKNIKEKMSLDLRKRDLHLQYFDTDILFDKEKIITIHDITKLIPYSNILQKLDPQSGQMTIRLGKDIHFLAKIEKDNDICYKNGHVVKKFLIKGSIGKKSLIQINDCATITIDKDIVVYIKNIEIDLDRLNLGSNNKRSLDRTVLVRIDHVRFKKSGHTVLIDHGEMKIEKFRRFLDAKLHKGSIKATLLGDLFEFKATGLGDRTVNDFFGKKIVKDGDFNIFAKGKRCCFEGNISFTQTKIERLKLINNLFAFLNTIPAILTLQNPGFDSEGLFVKKGFIDYIYEKGMIKIKRLHIVSQAITFDGYGIIDSKKRTIHLFLDLKTLKPITNIVKNIPLAGYILLGKEGSISIGVEVTGRLDDPTIVSHATKDTIKAPFNIIKRTLGLPFKLFH